MEFNDIPLIMCHVDAKYMHMYVCLSHNNNNMKCFKQYTIKGPGSKADTA